MVIKFSKIQDLGLPVEEYIIESDEVEEVEEPLMVGDDAAGNIPSIPTLTTLPTDKRYKLHVNQIQKNYARYTKMFGVPIEVYKANNSEQFRCSKCTERETQAVLSSSCPICFGTGYAPPYVSKGASYGLLQRNQSTTSTSPFGNTREVRDTMFISGDVFELGLGDIIVIPPMGEAYEIVDNTPEIAAIQGTIVSQLAAVSRLPLGDSIYRWLQL